MDAECWVLDDEGTKHDWREVPCLLLDLLALSPLHTRLRSGHQSGLACVRAGSGKGELTDALG